LTRLYGLRNFDACRNAINWLKDHCLEYEFVDIRNDGMEEKALMRWQELLGWEALLNKRSITWRNISAIERRDLDSTKARHLILRHPTVMKRPVLDSGSGLVLGFDESKYKTLDLQAW
jgi:arsenate reductase